MLKKCHGDAAGTHLNGTRDFLDKLMLAQRPKDKKEVSFSVSLQYSLFQLGLTLHGSVFWPTALRDMEVRDMESAHGSIKVQRFSNAANAR